MIIWVGIMGIMTTLAWELHIEIGMHGNRVGNYSGSENLKV